MAISKIKTEIRKCAICGDPFSVTGEWGEKKKKYCSLICREEGNLINYKKRLEKLKYEREK
jgi:hypothetical protein